MNKIALISDLHLDFWLRAYRQMRVRDEKTGEERAITAQDFLNAILKKCLDAKPDLIVIAGDFANGAVEQLTPKRDGNVITIPGNHCFYGFELPEEPEFYEEDNLIATTMWTNFDGARGMEAVIFKGISDNREIKNITWMKVSYHHQQSVDRIFEKDPEIVITHFPPSTKSVSDRYRGDMYNPYFVNNLDNKMFYESKNIKLWMFGHVHHRHHYTLGDRILCASNPLGYPGENYRSFFDYEPMIIVKENDIWRIEELKNT